MRTSRRKAVWVSVALGLALTVAACGGSSSSPAAPSPSPGGGGGGGTGGGSSTTITITASGVSPKNLTVPRGTQVTVVNNDTRSHDFASNPHPEHTDCPELNAVGFISPGQTRNSGALNTARICGYHDHNDPFNAAWQGTITIQ